MNSFVLKMSMTINSYSKFISRKDVRHIWLINIYILGHVVKMYQVSKGDKRKEFPS